LTPEEVAAVTAVTVALQRRAADVAATADADGARVPQLNAWVDASRRSAQRALLQRGPWRLSGRIGRRSRT
jgi:Arc/MetJ family transcription regulator